MKKSTLLLLPFFIGLVLMILSWYLSYPIVTSSSNDFVYNHISTLYWISVPLLSGSMFLMALSTKNNILKWLLSLGIVLTFVSLTYFYSMSPTVDSQFFRGLSEYFTKTQNLDASQANHSYYQWPALFIFADIFTSVSGLSQAAFEFILFTVITLLVTTSLYIYGSKRSKSAGIITVTAFFLAITYFLDYQAVPFTLALGFLFLLFMLDNLKKTSGVIVTMVIVYACLLFTHLFVPLFFVLYLFIRSLIGSGRRNRSLYGYLFLSSLVAYFLVEFTLAKFSFTALILSVIKAPAEYSYIISETTSTSQVIIPLNGIAQTFSRIVTIAGVAFCIIGFLVFLLKRKAHIIDIAIFTTGAVYTALGLVLNTLGERAIAILIRSCRSRCSIFGRH